MLRHPLMCADTLVQSKINSLIISINIYLRNTVDTIIFMTSCGTIVLLMKTAYHLYNHLSVIK